MQITYKEVSIDEAIEQLKTVKIVALDTEVDTKGSNFYGKLSSIQLYNGNWNDEVLLILDWRTEPYSELYKLLDFIKEKDIKVVMHNSAYDITHFNEETKTSWYLNIEDTLFLARIVEPYLNSYSLDNLPLPDGMKSPYDDLDKKLMQKSKFFKGGFTESQKKYAAFDAYITWHVFMKQIDEYNKCPRLVYDLNKKASLNILDMQKNGMPVDVISCDSEFTKLQLELDSLDLSVNPNSVAQVRKFLGLDSKASTDAKALSYMSILDKNEDAKKIKRARTIIKYMNFLDKFRATDDGYLRGRYSVTAKSGRTTCREFPMQTIPRNLKMCFGFQPDDGLLIGYADFSQLELRTMAIIANDELMIETFKKGEDIHTTVCKRIFGNDFTKEQRTTTKHCNFNLLYGGSALTMQNLLLTTADLYLPEDEIRDIISDWGRILPGVRKWQRGMLKKFEAGELEQTPFGLPYFADRGPQMLNIKNQGAGAEIAKIALNDIHQKLPEGSYMINFIHDSYLIACNEKEDLEAISKIMSEAMQEAWRKYCSVMFREPDEIPMPVSIGFAKNWNDVEGSKAVATFDY